MRKQLTVQCKRVDYSQMMICFDGDALDSLHKCFLRLNRSPFELELEGIIPLGDGDVGGDSDGDGDVHGGRVDPTIVLHSLGVSKYEFALTNSTQLQHATDTAMFTALFYLYLNGNLWGWTLDRRTDRLT